MPKTNINLLPSKLAPRSSVLKLVRFIKKGIILGFSLYTICAVGSIAAFLFLSNQLKEHSVKENELKKSIKALEETEQKLILTQDRLGKTEAVFGKATVKEELVSLGPFVKELPEGITFSKAEMSPEKYVISISTKNSEEFAELFSDLSENENYKQVVLGSYSYSEEGGYSAVLKLTI